MHYVVIGTRGAVAIHRGFSCTREELPRELRTHARYMTDGKIGAVIKAEAYSSAQAADAIAAHYNATATA
jgi:hypothetical protein